MISEPVEGSRGKERYLYRSYHKKFGMGIQTYNILEFRLQSLNQLSILIRPHFIAFSRPCGFWLRRELCQNGGIREEKHTQLIRICSCLCSCK